MRIKFWLSSLLTDIHNRFRFGSNRQKRWSKRKLALRTMTAALAVSAIVPLCEHTASAQCGRVMFPGERFPVENRPLSVTTGDFNGDGISDLATANESSDDVSVLLGLGSGIFATQQTFFAGDRPWSVTTGDFNGDGITDLATANLGSDDVSVLLGLGDGTFATQQTFSAGDTPLSVATADFNGDGITDLATANFTSDDVSVLIGLGDGTFATQQTFSAGDFSGSVVTVSYTHLTLPTKA